MQCARRDSRRERRHTLRHNLHRPVRPDGDRYGQDVGRADYPTIYTAHPIENLSREALRARAAELAPLVVQVLTGEG